MSQNLGLSSSSHRVYNNTALQMLGATARVLSKVKLLNQHDADDLRIELAQLGQSNDQAQSLLIDLMNRKAGFWYLVKAHFGSLTWGQNLLRLGIRNSLEDLLTATDFLTQVTIFRAQTLFNRSFYLYVNGVAEQKILYSTLLVELAEFFIELKERLIKTKELLGAYQLSSNLLSSQGTSQIHESLGQELGFDTLREANLLFVEERRSRETLRSFIRELCESLDQVLKFLDSQNLQSNDFKIAFDALATQASLFGEFRFPDTNDIETIEAKRADFQKLILQTARNVRKIAECFDAHLSEHLKISRGTSSVVLPESTLLTATTAMVSEGVAAQNAVAASAALVKYCSDHGVGPQDIIVGELSRIHPHLTTKSLESIKKHYVAAELGSDLSEEKQRTLDRYTDLLAKFQKKLGDLGIHPGSLSIFLLLLFFANSCGVKTAPKSTIVDDKPSIPFHEKMEPEQKSSKKPKNNNPSGDKQK